MLTKGLLVEQPRFASIYSVGGTVYGGIAARRGVDAAILGRVSDARGGPTQVRERVHSTTAALLLSTQHPRLLRCSRHSIDLIAFREAESMSRRAGLRRVPMRPCPPAGPTRSSQL
eukprot:3936729-Rhodomonas_salina.3